MANSTVLVSPPPRETPFLTRDGRISEPWVEWFSSITSTATIVQNLQQLQIIAEDNSTDANTGAIVAELLDAIALLATPPRPPAAAEPVIESQARDWSPEIAELRALVSSTLEQAQAWRAEADELRAVLAASDVFPGAQVASMISTTALLPANNLSDVASASTSLSNLGGASLTAANTFTAATNNFTQKVAIGSSGAPGAPLDVTGNAYVHGGNLYIDNLTGYTGPTITLGNGSNLTLTTSSNASLILSANGTGTVQAGSNLKLTNNATGSGSAALGANCPAVTASAPYTWLKMTANDGSTVYVPAWK